MSQAPVRVLVVDDDPLLARALAESLRYSGYETRACTSGHAALDALRAAPFDLLLTDLVMPEMGGVDLVVEAQHVDPQVAAVVMTGGGSIESAVAAMKAGALDYIQKPIDLPAVIPVLERAAAIRRLRLENLQLRDTVAIHELSQAIAWTLDQAELLDRIVDAALAQFQADEASIMLVSADGESLYLASIRGGNRERLLGSRVRIGEGIAGWVAAHGEPIELHGAVADKRVRAIHPRSEIKSALSLPMVTRGKLIGVLNVNCTRERRSFPVGQINVVSIFTNAAAASIRTAALLEQERRSDARYREVLQMVDEAVVSIDHEFRIVVFNHAAAAVFGWAPDQVLGQPFDTLWAAEVAAVHRWPLHAIAFRPADDHPGRGRERLIGRRLDGSLVPLEVGFSQSAGVAEHLITAVMRDVTREVAQEEKIVRLTRLYATLSAVNSATIRIRDTTVLLEEICRIANDEGGFRGAWVARVDEAGALVVVHRAGAVAGAPAPDATGPAAALVAAALEHGRVAWENTMGDDGPGSCAVIPFIVDGTVHAVMGLEAERAAAFGDRELHLLRALASDVSSGLEHIRNADRHSYLATHDPVTGLANRAAFVDRLTHALATAERTRGTLAVVVTDLERFNQVNQSFGREGGDTVLRQLADRYRVVAQDAYSLARLGGDCFAGIRTEDTSPAALAKSVGERVGVALAAPFVIDGQNVHLSGRAGIATYPADGTDAESLLANAEAALRRAKAEHQQLMLYTPDLNNAVIRQLAVETRLRRALERGELVLHYQPQVELATGRIVVAEALLRWQDPEQGLVAPGELIPVLEDTGLILEVGRWIMSEAVRAAAHLRQRHGHAIRVAVNVSPVQLRHDDFLLAVEAALRAAGGDPHALDLEVTETVVMHDVDASIARLAALRELGVRVAIDDFGSGYSTLAYLARLPADAVKVDRSFVGTMTSDPDHTSIVATVISLAHALHRAVIAEGVEDHEQARLLRLLRCDRAQGFLFGRPMPLAELERALVPA